MRRVTLSIQTKVGLAGLLAACLTCSALTATPGSAASSTASAGASAVTARANIVHEGRNWSWTGPRNWTAAYGTYGITISSDHRSGFDLGFSTIFCTAAPSAQASAVRYMRAQRGRLARGGARIIRTTALQRKPGLGPNYFRQTVNIATRSRGVSYLGQVIYDYEVSDPQYCYQRSVAFGAPRRGYAASLRELLRVFNSLAYFGPGAYED